MSASRYATIRVRPGVSTPLTLRPYEEMISQDKLYDEFFNLSKVTVMKLTDQVHKTLEYANEDKESIAKSICMLAYYLVFRQASLTIVKLMFGMEDEVQVLIELIRISKALHNNGDGVREGWPTLDETYQTGVRIYEKYKFPGVAGIMGFWVFGNCYNGVILQAVVDDTYKFLNVNAVEIKDGHPSPFEYFVNTNTFYYVTECLPDDFSVLASEAYDYDITNMIVPYDDSLLCPRRRIFNSMVHACLEIFELIIVSQAEKFPKLLSIGMNPAEAKHLILASCVLHNAAVRDQPYQ